MSGQRPESQQASPTPTFKGRIDIVRTDVAVINKKTGKAVTDLTVQDFSVTENGVRQTITGFMAEVGDTRAGETTPGELSAIRTRRVFLVVFGGGRLDGPVRPYDGVIRFFQERLRPSDLVAVMAWNRVTEFTTDHSALVRLVERLGRPPDDLLQRRNRPSAELSDETQAAIDGMFQPPGQSSLPVRSAAALLLGTSEYRQNDFRWRSWNKSIAGLDILKVSAGIEYLRALEGEKHLILLTQSGIGPPLPILHEVGLRLHTPEDDRRFAARASEAQVALNIILTTGSETSVRIPTPAGGTLRYRFPGVSLRESSQNLADYSGGQFSSLRTAEDQLARIDDASKNGYVLGYVPTNAELDGKYRNVVITVNRKDVIVLYRHGYTARAELPSIDPRDLLTSTRLAEAAATDVPLDDLRVRAVAVNEIVSAGSRHVRIDLTVDPSHLSLTSIDGKRAGTIDLLVLCGDSRENLVGKLNQQWLVSIDEARYQLQAAGAGTPHSVVVPVSAAARYAKVIVYDYANDRLGSASVTVR